MPVDQVNDYKGRGDVLKHQKYRDACDGRTQAFNLKQRCGRLA